MNKNEKIFLEWMNVKKRFQEWEKNKSIFPQLQKK